MLSVELPQCGIALQPRILLPFLERGPRVWGDGGCAQRPPPATAPTCGSSVPLQGQVLIRKLSVWKWEISRRGGGCCGTGKLRDESPCGNETTGMSPTFGQTPPPPRRGAHPPPPPTGLAQDSRAEATMSLHLCAGAGDANPPQSHPKSPHSICPSPIPPPRQPQWAEATEVPADRHPTASRHGSML